MHDPLSHRPVLLNEVLTALALDPAGIYLDATFGRGGHSRAILQHLGPTGQLWALDQDPEAIAAGQALAAAEPRFQILHCSFAALAATPRPPALPSQFHGLLFDLGVSSPQLDNPERGFSFLRDGPLDMRMNTSAGQSAAAWLATVSEADLANALKTYGEERYAKRISRAILAARQQSPLTTTRRLAEVIAAAHPAWEKHKHPATRSFQAIRILINRELDALTEALHAVPALLRPAGRLAVISFHSLEDRIVKQFIRDQARGEQYPPDLPIPEAQIKASRRLRALGKAISASEAELAENPRARSAVLRVAERLDTP